MKNKKSLQCNRKRTLKKAKNNRIPLLDRRETSQNHTSNIVNEDEDNMETQKKVRMNYVSKKAKQISIYKSDNECSEGDDDKSDSSSVSEGDYVDEENDTSNKIGECEGTIKMSINKDDEMSSITNSTTRLQGKNIEELLSIVKQQEHTITSLLNKKGDGDGYMVMNPIQETNLLKTTKFELFRYVQFIRHDSILENFTSKNSIGAFVMNKLGVDTTDRTIFWRTYMHVVRKGIKVQRNITHSALKKQFLCKYLMNVKICKE